MTDPVMDKADALNIAADWLCECMDCGKKHEYRLAYPQYTQATQRTWSDPDDKHAYRPRGTHETIERLRDAVAVLRGGQ